MSSGLLALGDSITRGRGGFPALGVHPLSWAQWLAEALELPYRSLASDGAQIGDLLRVQLPRVPAPPVRWDVVTLYIGVNDARGLDFDGTAFEAGLRTAVERLAPVADRLLMVTLPLDLGRPRAGEDVRTANAAIRRVAAAAGATVLDLEHFGGMRFVLPDAVHPTSLGMVEIAERAVRALGVTVARRPSELADVRLGRLSLARYARWYAWQALRDRRRRWWERRRS